MGWRLDATPRAEPLGARAGIFSATHLPPVGALRHTQTIGGIITFIVMLARSAPTETYGAAIASLAWPALHPRSDKPVATVALGAGTPTTLAVLARSAQQASTRRYQVQAYATVVHLGPTA